MWRQGYIGDRVHWADDFFFQTAPKAVAFYGEKVKGLEANLQELEKIVQTKSSQLRITEES